MLNFQALNKPKMGTSLCDVTMTLKRQEKMETYFLNSIPFSTRNCMFDTFTQKFPRDYTAAYTIIQAQRITSFIQTQHITKSNPSTSNHKPYSNIIHHITEFKDSTSQRRIQPQYITKPYSKQYIIKLSSNTTHHNASFKNNTRKASFKHNTPQSLIKTQYIIKPYSNTTYHKA